MITYLPNGFMYWGSPTVLNDKPEDFFNHGMLWYLARFESDRGKITLKYYQGRIKIKNNNKDLQHIYNYPTNFVQGYDSELTFPNGALRFAKANPRPQGFADWNDPEPTMTKPLTLKDIEDDEDEDLD